jgi:tetratricopeptide (TPR) repeat protein
MRQRNEEISKMRTNPLRRGNAKTAIGWLSAAVAALLLMGCVTTAPVKPATAPEASKPVGTKTAGVKRLDNGRQGFVITEVGQMSDAVRRDFDNAVSLLNQKDYEKAIALLKQIVEQSPGVSAPHVNLGIAYQRTGKQDMAEAQFKTALSLVPGHPVVCNQYGLLCRKSGRFEQAQTLYKQALTAFPEYYPVHRNLGILCDLYLNDLPCALEHYEVYSRRAPEDQQVKLWIADLRARLGKK